MHAHRNTNKPLDVFLAMVSPELRRRIVGVFEELGCTVHILEANESVAGVAGKNRLIVIETGDDAALLTRLVYRLYAATGDTSTIPVIGILSVEAFNMNPSVMMWTVDDHDAVLAMLSTQGLEENMHQFAGRIIKYWPGQDQTEE